MSDIQDAVRENETIELVSGSINIGLIRSTFRHCVIVGRITASNLTVVDSVFDQCEIRWKKPLNHKNWLRTKFSGCVFFGRYIGNRFGHQIEGPRCTGDMVDCDLSQAYLHGTDFLSCDMSRIKLPGWPFFTLLDPAKNKEVLLKAAEGLPLELKIKLEVGATAYEETSAVTWSGTEVAKRMGITEDEVLAYVKQIPGVVC